MSLVTLTLVAVPAAAQSSPLLEVPRGREVRPNRQLLEIGAGVLVAAYLPSAVVGATSTRTADDWLLVPVIGPWGAFGGRETCQVVNGSCGSNQLWALLYITSGVMQVAGATSIIASFIIPERWPEHRVGASERPKVRVTPMQVSKDGYGLGMVGRW